VGIQFQACKNPDVKCAFVERAQRTIRERLYKYFTYKNTLRYINISPKICQGLPWHGLLDERHGALACDRFERPRYMEENGG